MRYEKSEKILQLALDMQALRGGISLGEICEKYEVSKRTAMRMRDAIFRIFPQAEENITDEKIKRFKIPSSTMNRLIDFTADEIASLEVALNMLKRDNLSEHAKNIENTAIKIKALLSNEKARKVEPDLEALLEAEGLAMRPGPKILIKEEILENLRYAIKAGLKTKITYKKSKTKQSTIRTVMPYGFLHGHRHYLVANTKEKQKEIKLFKLSNIDDVEITNDFFERDKSFSLKKFAEQSFGVFQEKPFNVKWKFNKKSSQTAQEFEFHPNQKIKKFNNGSIIVEFEAGGLLEMCWHLYQWGDNVEVLEPKELKEMIKNHKRSWPTLP